MKKVYARGLNFAGIIFIKLSSDKLYEKKYKIIHLNYIAVGISNKKFRMWISSILFFSMFVFNYAENGQMLKNGYLMDSLTSIRQINVYRLFSPLVKIMQVFHINYKENEVFRKAHVF
jgi:hypothetical protein